MKDPVVRDEQRYDRVCEMAKERFDAALHVAETNYENGDYHDDLVDFLRDDPTDCCKLALAYIDGMKSGDMELHMSRQKLAIAGIEQAIEDFLRLRAEEIMESF